MSDKIHVGIGYDVHALAAGRKLILGGVNIPFDRGLSGWSDADVLVHAIIDALLGAAALGDIGVYFPPGDPKYRDISSLILLKTIRDELKLKGWRVNNIDTTIVAEKPRLRDFIERMRENISATLDVEVSRVNVKATTSEGLGFIGAGEGIAAYAVATVEAK